MMILTKANLRAPRYTSGMNNPLQKFKRKSLKQYSTKSLKAKLLNRMGTLLSSLDGLDASYAIMDNGTIKSDERVLQTAASRLENQVQDCDLHSFITLTDAMPAL